MNSTASVASGTVASTPATTSEALTLDHIASAPLPPFATRYDRTRALAVQQGNWNDKVDSASLARLSPRGMIDRFIKTGLIEIDTGGNQSIKGKLVQDLVDIASTSVGKQTLLGALKSRHGGAGYTPFSVRVEPGTSARAYGNAVTFGAKHFAEDCHLDGDTVSSARSVFVLFHEIVHIGQFKALSSITYAQMEDDATARTDVFTAQFNRVNGTEYPKRITYGETTNFVCPVLTSKQMTTPDQLKTKIEELKVRSKSGRVTQRDFVEHTLGPIIRKTEDLVRIEFGSDTLRAPGGSGRRKRILDCLVTLRSAIAPMRNDKPVVPAQLDTVLQVYKRTYKTFFDGMSIDNLPSLPRRRNGGVVKQ